MSVYEIRFTKQAIKDIRSLSPQLQSKLRDILLKQVATNPYLGKRLVGSLAGLFSLRLSYKDRMVYEINEAQRTVVIHRAKTHYGD